MKTRIAIVTAAKPPAGYNELAHYFMVFDNERCSAKTCLALVTAEKHPAGYNEMTHGCFLQSVQLWHQVKSAAIRCWKQRFILTENVLPDNTAETHPAR